MSDDYPPDFGEPISEIKTFDQGKISLDGLPVNSSVNPESPSSTSTDSTFSQKSNRKQEKVKLLAEVELEEMTRSTY